MVIVIDQYTPTEEFIKILSKSFNKQLELKSVLTQKITTTKGGEQLSWIKKYNGLLSINGVIKKKKLFK